MQSSLDMCRHLLNPEKSGMEIAAAAGNERALKHWFSARLKTHCLNGVQKAYRTFDASGCKVSVAALRERIDTLRPDLSIAEWRIC